MSDKPGHHDFELLKRLVLSDGSVLRCKLPGRPTKECIFTDVSRDGRTALKMWNMNDVNGKYLFNLCDLYGGLFGGDINCQSLCSWDIRYGPQRTCNSVKMQQLFDSCTIASSLRPKAMSHGCKL